MEEQINDDKLIARRMSNIIKISILFLGIICLSNSSCDKNSIDSIKTSDFNKTFDLSLNEQVILPKDQKELMITLTSLNDSRCAENVQCVWAGNASIELTITDETGASSAVKLCLGQCDNQSKASDAAVIKINSNTYTVNLSEITRSANEKTPAKAVLMIQKT